MNDSITAPDDHDPMMRVNPLEMFILSQDTLFGTRMDQTIDKPGWSARPSRKEGITGERQALKELCRRGIPPALRCATWVTNVTWTTHPEMTKHEAEEHGTLKRVQVLEHGWDLVLKSCFPDESDEDNAAMPDFGLGSEHLETLLRRDHGSEIPEKGLKAFKRVLYAAYHSLGIEYCPLLPDISAILLTVMEEAIAYAVIRDMLNDSSRYFALTRVEHIAWCKTFGDLVKKRYPQTYYAMKGIGALMPSALDPIFKRFFVTVLRREHVLRIMDLYTLEGANVLLRVGTVLVCLYHAHIQDFNIHDATSWWTGVSKFAHSKDFKFEVFLQHQAYGVQKGLIFSRPIFPRRDFVERILAKNEEWAEDNPSYHAAIERETPIGFVENEVPVVLAKHAPERAILTEWLPSSLKSTRLELIYSTNVDGRSVELFYRHCSRARHTITLLEVLNTNTTLGMFATHTWHNNPRGYGDGKCFLFRLQPNPVCFKWKPPAPGITFIPGDLEHIQAQMADQFMISGDHFISMGVGKDGASGLRLNDDLTCGSTSPAMGFGGENLLGDSGHVFDVGLVEAYRLVREVDGKPVDGEEEDWRGMFN